MALPQDDMGQGEHVFVDILIYGDSGAGKTFRAATAPQPLYVMSPDPTSHKAIPYKTPGKRVTSLDDVQEVVNGFYEGGHGFNTLLIDGLNFLHDMFVQAVGQQYHDERGAQDADLMPIQGRLKVQAMFSRFLRSVIDLSQVDNVDDRVHVIFTTLSERLKEDDIAPFQIRPMIGTQKMNEKFPAMFSVVSFIYARGGEDKNGNLDKTREMLFTPQHGVMAKDRIGIFPDAGEAPDLSEYLYQRKKGGK